MEARIDHDQARYLQTNTRILEDTEAEVEEGEFVLQPFFILLSHFYHPNYLNQLMDASKIRRCDQRVTRYPTGMTKGVINSFESLYKEPIHVF